MKTNGIDLGQAVVVSPPDLSGPEKNAVRMLVKEVEKRTRIRWKSVATWPSTQTPAIAVGPASALRAFAGPHADEIAAEGEASAAEGYRIRVKVDGAAPAVLVVGNDARGVLFGVGHLLRALRMHSGSVTLPGDLNVTTAPRYRLRGHQLGYRDKTNSYCGWDLAQWEQYIGDLAVFGCNAIELIPPRSDDNPDSVHFALPPLEMMAGMSQIADDYGLDLWIWYPAMDEAYDDPATVEFARDEWGQVFHTLPRIDALFVPGGDPGRTQPRYLIALLEKQTALLRSIHPAAQMWVSPQGFTQEWTDEFVGILKEESPDWLTGVVFGPWVHMTLDAFRDMIPARYPIRNYPDITHNLSCQHPVPDWDMAYALTEGRESINPRPLDMAAIFRREQPPTIGFLTYSEGCHDDVNKCVWSALGWDPEREVIDILREYSRYYIGEDYADDFAQGLLALERNWHGPVAVNAGIYTTVKQFQAMEQAALPRDLKNWRFQQALYRAYYDAHVRSRLLYESGLEEQAIDQLRQARDKGSPVALAEAERILDRAVHQPISLGWRTRIYQLAEALFQSVHMQLSVPLYRAQREVRGANLDGIDYPLNDRPWLKARFAEIRGMQEEDERLEAIDALLNWGNPGPGGFYDDLSVPSPQGRLVPGPGYAEDPTFLRSPLRHYPYRKHMPPLRRSWRSYTGALGDAPFEMRYTGLAPEAHYVVRVVYSDAEPLVRIRLEARPGPDEALPDGASGGEASGVGIEIHPFILKAAPRAPMEFEVPPEATRHGELVLRWYREPGMGHAGRGCEISEIWLIKV